MGYYRTPHIKHHVVFAAMAAVFAGLYGSGIFDPSTLLRVGWRTGLLPLVMFRHVDLGPEGGFFVPRASASAEWIEKVHRFQPLADDVFIATFPKSGTHFTMQLALQTLSGGQRDFESVHHASTCVEFEVINPKRCDDPKILTIDNYKDLEPNRRGVHASHLPAEVLLAPGAKTIVMMRNPVDVLASYHLMIAKMLGPGAPTIEEFYQYFYTQLRTGWWQFNLDWWKRAQQNPERVLFLFYEDAVADPKRTIHDLAAFLDVQIDSDMVERIRHKASLAYMKPNKLKFETPRNCVSILPGVKSTTKKAVDMVNVGKAGRGKAKIPISIRKAIKHMYDETFGNTGFPIERYSNSIL